MAAGEPRPCAGVAPEDDDRLKSRPIPHTQFDPEASAAARGAGPAEEWVLEASGSSMPESP